ncbi:hypothetical protein OK016_17875 [Vibrio chagasii]|nr:hypothetical protein [Vibrio chagasii]
MSQNDVLNYNQTCSELLARNTNFIIEDFSGAVDFKAEPQLLVENFDVVVLVFDASKISVRSAKRLFEKIASLQLTPSSRTRAGHTLTTIARGRRLCAAETRSREVSRASRSRGRLAVSLAHIIIDGKRAHKHDRHVSRSMETAGQAD